jgi:hypothetical protein
VSGNLGAGLPISQEIPKVATIEIVLLTAPGLNAEESKWEISYEFRLANDATLWQAWKKKQRAEGSLERVGELIKEAVVKRPLRSPDDRKVILQIPLGPEIQEKLRNQPLSPVKIPSGQPTPEQIKLMGEQEMLTQSFLFQSVINIYDAKLKKTLLVPISFRWPFRDYRRAQFEIKVEINDDGSYSVKTFLPT